MRNNKSADIDILVHILRYCNNIRELIERFGEDIEIFKQDIAYRDSVSMNILQIGELAGRLSEEYRRENKKNFQYALPCFMPFSFIYFAR